MRKFSCRPFGDVDVDLDDTQTYIHLPDSIGELRKLILSEIGYAYCYMNYWHPEIFKTVGFQQKNRVLSFIEAFALAEKNNRENVMWYKEQVFLFQDEIENMC